MKKRKQAPAMQAGQASYASPPCYLAEFDDLESSGSQPALSHSTNPHPMNRDQLFLLKHDFSDNAPHLWYCPGCAELVGLLEMYPQLKQTVDVHHIGFQRPRPELVPLLGEENQSCPVLVLHSVPPNLPADVPVQHAKERAFVEGAREIATYFARVHGSGMPH